MVEMCRVCLKRDPRIPFSSLTDEETNDLFEECTNLKINAQDDQTTCLCSECHYQCLEWKKFKNTAIKSHQQLDLLSGTNGLKSEPDQCFVCQEDTKSHSLIDKDLREIFMDCTSIVLEEQEAKNQLQLCDECSNICQRWRSFRFLAIESDQKLKHLPVGRLNCQVEIIRCDCLDMGTVSVKLEYSIDIVKQELPVEEDTSVGNEHSLNGAEFAQVIDPSCIESDVPAAVKDTRRGLPNARKCHQCRFCLQYFKSRRSLGNHRRIHTDEKIFQCDLCDKSFTRKGQLIEHKQIHTAGNISEREKEGQQTFQCDFCDKSFTDYGRLAEHKRMHTEDKPYQCEYCFRSFRFGGNVTRHERTHTGENAYQCDVCRMSFMDYSTLLRHQQTHGVRKRLYLCAVCSRSFGDRSTLSKHELTHIDEKPFQCEECNKSFHDEFNLKIHKRVHGEEKRYQCDKCSESFRDNSDLILHKTTHTEAGNNLNVISNEDHFILVDIDEITRIH